MNTASRIVLIGVMMAAMNSSFHAYPMKEVTRMGTTAASSSGATKNTSLDFTNMTIVTDNPDLEVFAKKIGWAFLGLKVLQIIFDAIKFFVKIRLSKNSS